MREGGGRRRREERGRWKGKREGWEERKLEEAVEGIGKRSEKECRREDERGEEKGRRKVWREEKGEEESGGEKDREVRRGR